MILVNSERRPSLRQAFLSMQERPTVERIQRVLLHPGRHIIVMLACA